MACLGNLVERLGRGHVHDVERYVAGNLRQHDGAVCGLALEVRRARDGVVLRVALAAGECLCNEHVDGDAVLGMHHDERTALRGGLHGLQDLAVVAVEDARVGHEQLEAGDALVLGEVLHGLQRFVVDTADDLAERVVDCAVGCCLVVPLGERVVDVAAVALHRHVADGGDPAPCRRTGPGLEGVRGLGTAEGQFEVRVHVDTAGDDVLAGGIDDPVAIGGGRAGEVHRSDDLAVDQHVLGDLARGADDGSILDDDAHVVSLRDR